ncbi:MAG: zinc ribbon domain-containing protein [Deltaproteobacteria bacterium]|nr:zinc ribbon domain-containing protein [Deltaproteobacteria bacterium]
MPLYEFQCQNCGETEEFLMKISDPAPESCQSCKKGPLTKVMSRTHFVLKGQGWYETDFKNKKSQDSAKGKAQKTDATQGKSNHASEGESGASSAPDAGASGAANGGSSEATSSAVNATKGKAAAEKSGS